MSIFGKKQEEKVCDCGGKCNGTAAVQTESAAVKVLGGGCAKCNQLEAAAKTALSQLGMDTAIEHVTDFSAIAAYGVMSTPALVVDGKVVSFGKVLKSDEIVKLLQKVRGGEK